MSSSAFYASTSGSDTATSCPSSAPCSLNQAISLAQAAAGGDVVVEAGTYSVSSPIALGNGITLEGDPAGARPVLAGSSTLAGTALSATGGSTVRYLEVDNGASTTQGYSAVELDGATAQNLIAVVTSADQNGTALDLEGASGSTVASTVLAEAQASNSEAVSFSNITPPNTATLVHGTAVATGSSAGAISSAATGSGEASVQDTIADGKVSVKPSSKGATSYQPASFAYSDLNGTPSGDYVNGGNNNAATPKLTSTYQEQDGAATIGAGYAYASQTASDLAGTVWSCPPDMGAYQSGAGGCPPPAATTTTDSSGSDDETAAPGDTQSAAKPQLPPLAAPVAGKSVALHPAGGTVEVELPGTHVLIALSRAASIPSGTLIDTTHGAVRLTSAVSTTGAVKSGTFNGGRFVVTQKRASHPVTELQLRGGSFSTCPAAAAADTGTLHAPLAFTRRRTSRKVIRRLWGSDHGGRFQTLGHSASATVRGTVWLTEDRCDGTLVQVKRGAVVVHDRARHRNVLVRAGHSYLARAAR